MGNHTATTGRDTIKGTEGEDDFDFTYKKGAKDNTLNHGDTIDGYDFGEFITITGTNGATVTKQIYDKDTDTTYIQIDADGDGKVDVVMKLTGDMRGLIEYNTNCCLTPETTFRIKRIPEELRDKILEDDKYKPEDGPGTETITSIIDDNGGGSKYAVALLDAYEEVALGNEAPMIELTEKLTGLSPEGDDGAFAAAYNNVLTAAVIVDEQANPTTNEAGKIEVFVKGMKAADSGEGEGEADGEPEALADLGESLELSPEMLAALFEMGEGEGDYIPEDGAFSGGDLPTDGGFIPLTGMGAPVPESFGELA